MAAKGSFSSLFKKGKTTGSNDREAEKKLTQTLLQKLINGDSDSAVSILNDTDQSDESRAKVIAFCETLANVGLKPARKALAIALKNSPIFRAKEAVILPHIRMTAVKEGDTVSQICERILTTLPNQVFITGGGIFNEVISAQQDLRDALGEQYNIRVLNTTSRALIRHSLIALKREIQANPGRKNLVIGVYPTVSWSNFLPFPPSAYDLFSPWPRHDRNAAVFLIGPLSYAYVIEVASQLNGADSAPGLFENIVCTGNSRLTNQEYEQLQAAASPEEQSKILLQISKDILKSHTELQSSGTAYTGPLEVLEGVKHEAFAEMYLSRGLFRNAIPELEQVIALERDRRIFADQSANLALCHAQLGNFGQAVSILQKVSGINPELASESHQIIEQLQLTDGNALTGA
jgi:tetratricopeptide (TPR) repeat protein